MKRAVHAVGIDTGRLGGASEHFRALSSAVSSAIFATADAVEFTQLFEKVTFIPVLYGRFVRNFGMFFVDKFHNAKSSSNI